MLLASAKFASANYFVHNETNKYGYGNDITVENDHDADRITIKPGEKAELKMFSGRTDDRLRWKDGNNRYETKELFLPKDIYIYSPCYLIWQYTSKSNKSKSLEINSGILKGTRI
jgi:hypothetical protein